MFRALLDWRRHFKGASQENPWSISPKDVWNSASRRENETKQGAGKSLYAARKRGSNDIRTKTDTGGQGEQPKGNGRTFVKELGKKARRKFARCLPRHASVGAQLKCPKRLFIKNTGLC
jgi:hypothetical protein